MTDINKKIQNSDRLLLTGDGWQLLFIDDLSLSDDNAKREQSEKTHDNFAVDILAIYIHGDEKQALFTLRYIINLSNEYIKTKNVYNGTHPINIGNNIIDADKLNFIYWSEDNSSQTRLKSRLDEKLQIIAGGWMIVKYRNNSKKNLKILDETKDDLIRLLDKNIDHFISL